MENMNKPKVISQVVDNDLCIGCGLCTYACDSNALSMDWNNEGFLVPTLSSHCDDDATCISVCPFNPNPEKVVKDEASIANIFLNQNTSIDPKLGRVINTYAGYSKKYRNTSSSGGIATYVFDKLLNQNIVDHIFCVSEGQDAHYDYTVISSPKDLTSSSKTKYYPVTLASVLDELNHLDGKVAIVGVACFVKAIRLAQYHDPSLKEKIPFIIGIICGGVKSKFYTEYLASKAGSESNHIKHPEYRIKDPDSVALDYSFGCVDLNDRHHKRIKMREVGDMWGTGLFKANACDFCEDVATELADISLGDAWIEPYKNDGKGTSIVITRSPLAEQLINNGRTNNELNIEELEIDKVIASQQGSFNHRQDGLYVRLEEAKKKGLPLAKKRHGKKPVSLDIYVVQKLRRLTRKRSLEIWQHVDSAVDFDNKMEKTLSRLRLATKVTHYKRAILRRVKGLVK